MKSKGMLDQERFQSYQILCELGARLFSEAPDDILVDRLIEQREHFKEPPFSAISPVAAEELFLLLEKAHKNKEAFIADIRQDYTYLFYMVGLSRTSPFESVYRTDDRTMFGPSTLQVREAYRAYEMKIEKENNIPDDHFGFELSFMGRLLALAAQTAGENNEGQTQDIVDDLSAFLSDHVLVFAPIYLKNVKIRARSEFFRSISTIMLDTITSLAVAFNVQASEHIDETCYLLDE